MLERIDREDLSPQIKKILQTFQDDTNEKDNLQLSRREKEILSLIEKNTNKEVGNKLFISEKTVKRHITNINKKLNVKNKFEALKKAQDLKMVE